jgi:hypothetical protein
MQASVILSTVIVMNAGFAGGDGEGRMGPCFD